MNRTSLEIVRLKREITEFIKSGHRSDKLTRSHYLSLQKRLEFYAKYWDLTNNILFCKFCGVDNIHQSSEIPREYIPDIYRQYGIGSIKVKVALQFRPLCLHRLSRHSKSIRGEKVEWRTYFLEELRMLESKLKLVKKYRANKVEFIVVPMSDLIWRAPQLRKRLIQFLPGLDGLDTAYFASDMISNATLNKKLPEAVGFNLSQNTCVGVISQDDEYIVLTEEEVDSYHRAVTFLFSFVSYDT